MCHSNCFEIEIFGRPGLDVYLLLLPGRWNYLSVSSLFYSPLGTKQPGIHPRLPWTPSVSPVFHSYSLCIFLYWCLFVLWCFLSVFAKWQTRARMLTNFQPQLQSLHFPRRWHFVHRVIQFSGHLLRRNTNTHGLEWVLWILIICVDQQIIASYTLIILS